MLCDYHVHTSFSGDSSTPGKLQIEQAIRLGMKELCITDHHDYGVDSGEIDFTLDVTSYLPALERLRNSYQRRIQIKTGIELGLQCHIREYLDGFMKKYAQNFDFIIGSSHFIDGQDPYYPELFENRSEQNVYERYFQVTASRVRMFDCYDVLGHLDYVVRYGPNTNQHYSFKVYQDFIDPILKSLIEKGKGLECNTGGYKAGLKHPNPCEDILKRYRELGGEIITIGSDAHTPEYLGFYFQKAESVLQQCGFRYYTIFEHRQPKFIKL